MAIKEAYVNLRNNDLVNHGFIEMGYISYEQQKKYMSVHGKNYYVIELDTSKMILKIKLILNRQLLNILAYIDSNILSSRLGQLNTGNLTHFNGIESSLAVERKLQA